MNHRRKDFACLLVAIPVLLALPATVRADSIRLSGPWIDNVRVEGVSDGQLAYRTAAGRRVERPLERVEGLHLDRAPALADAEQARADGEHATAATRFRAVARAADEEWLALYARMRIVEALDAQGEAVEAVELYTALIAEGAHSAYLSRPPVASVRRAPEDVRPRIAEALDAVAGEADALVREHLEAMRAALDADPDAPEPADDDSAVVLPADIERDAVTEHLRRGEFDAALEAVERTLSTTGRLPLGLYQKGVAQLAKAERDGDDELLRTAGLNFMRVIVYFPRSRHVGAALTEAGLVHARIGRPDLARRLYDRARLRIDEDDDPAYHARLLELIEQVREQQ